MIQFILGFFGYVRIPLHVVRLSIEQENFLEQSIEYEQSVTDKKEIQKTLEGQKEITSFLRAGRKLNH